MAFNNCGCENQNINVNMRYFSEKYVPKGDAIGSVSLPQPHVEPRRTFYTRPRTVKPSAKVVTSNNTVRPKFEKQKETKVVSPVIARASDVEMTHLHTITETTNAEKFLKYGTYLLIALLALYIYRSQTNTKKYRK